MNIGAETEWVEYKKTTGELREGLVSLCSMLNKNGYGTLYFGIKDSGQVTGQQIGNRTLREISQAIANHIKPQVIPTIVMEYLDDKNVIKVYAEGFDAPYSAYGKYFIRSADEDREMSPAQLRRMLLQKSESDFITMIPSSGSDLSFGLLRTLFAIKEIPINNAEFEKNLGLYLPLGQYNYMAELLADKNDVSVKVVTFGGKDKSNIIFRSEYGFKCLLVAMDQVISYMESINATDVIMGTHQRAETKLFDAACFREAWVNACLHTRWDKKNPPAVYVYSDRIEIISTGGLLPDLTKDEFYRGISKPVNRKLQKIFGQLGYVEQTGHGIPLIINSYGKQAFEITDNFMIVTIPFSHKSMVSSEKKLVNTKPNEAETLIINLLQTTPTYTIKNLSMESGYSDGYVRKVLSHLKEKGLIKRVGSNKTGYWETVPFQETIR